ncbi:hypothetical protein Y032_0310g2107 [Ancylostoma ceylanicum]|uniref:Uncharacterized protein n=1 Tax=Ancylostoma ceylanicum TaxID=53326 RepID=A0A016S2A1_9BILA|nr:hypothetical protein Y032_0310g2107 [Ancylostoma ceylanicum]
MRETLHFPLLKKGPEGAAAAESRIQEEVGISRIGFCSKSEGWLLFTQGFGSQAMNAPLECEEKVWRGRLVSCTSSLAAIGNCSQSSSGACLITNILMRIDVV